MCDRPADKAVRSPWTDGAWLMLEEEVLAGWQVRVGPAYRWESPPCSISGHLVEARPTPQEDQ